MPPDCLTYAWGTQVAFRAPLLTLFAKDLTMKDLTIGSLYRASVAAANLNGIPTPYTLSPEP